MTLQTHVIGRQVLDIEVEDQGSAYELQQHLSEVFRGQVVPAMEALFERCVPEHFTLRVNRLDLDLGLLPVDALDDAFPSRVCEALERHLIRYLDATAASPLAQGASERLSQTAYVLELWHYVLSHGYLPWWAPAARARALEGEVLKVLASLDTLPESTLRLLQEDSVALHRVISQSGDMLLDRLLRLIAPLFAALAVPVFQFLEQLTESYHVRSLRPPRLRQRLWEAAVREAVHSTAGEVDEAVLQRLIGEFLSAPAFTASADASGFVDKLRSQVMSSRDLPSSLPPESHKILVKVLSQVDKMSSGSTLETEPINLRRMHELKKASSGLRAPESDDVQSTLDDSRERRDVSLQHPSSCSDDEMHDWERKRHHKQREHEPRVQSKGAGVHRDPDSVGEEAARTGRDETWHDSAGQDGSRQRDTPVSSPTKDAEHTASHDAQSLDVEDTADMTRRPAVAHREHLRDVFIDDAGAVLLHPFLSAHFERLDLLHESAFIDESARAQAVRQLRFLATGEDDAPEPLLVLAKVMCGMAPEDPMPHLASIDEVAKSEAEALLESAIRNWDALKKTSPDGLRESFLRREGRLEKKDGAWRLQVESRSYDMLLNRLPWAISVVRLPWMPHPLHVHWV